MPRVAKHLADALLVTLSLSGSQSLWAKSDRPDIFEITTYRLKSGTSVEEGKKLASDLNAVYKKLKGFEDRELYFDATQGVWMERVKWKHADAAKEGRDALSKDPAAQKLQAVVDPAAVQRFQGERQLDFEL